MTVAEIAVGPDRSHTFKPVSQLGWYTTLLLRFASGSAFIYAAAGFYQLSFLIKVNCLTPQFRAPSFQ